MADYFEEARQATDATAVSTEPTDMTTLAATSEATLTEGLTLMAYPPGISLATVTIGAGRTMFGAPPKLISATVTPVFKGTPHVVHAASGWAFYPSPRTFRVENGEELSFELPHVNAEGWLDTAGNEFPALLESGERDKGWAYHVKFTVVGGSGQDSAPHRYEKVFQPLVGQNGPIDVDLIPDGQIGEPVSAPVATVTDFLGLSGSITKEALEAAGLGAPSDTEIAELIQDETTSTGAAFSNALKTRIIGTPDRLTVALSLRNQGPVDIVMVGDSSTEGAGASSMENNYVSQVARALAAAYNPAGVPGGMSWQAYSSVTTAANGWTLAGTTTITEDLGLSGQSRTFASGASMTRTATMTGVTILFEAGASPFTVKFDDAGEIQVTPTASQRLWSSPSLTDGSHIVKIAAPTGGLSVSHVYLHRNDRNYGVRVWNAGKGSSRMYHWLTPRAASQRAAIAAIKPAGLTLMMGTNDHADGETATNYGLKVRQWIDGIVTALGYTPWVGLLGQFHRTSWNAEQATLWEAMKAQLQTIASERPYVTYHDVSKGFSVDNSDPFDLVGADNTHLTDRGYALTAQNTLESLAVPARSTRVVPAATNEPLPAPFVDLHNTVALFDADKVTATDGANVKTWTPFAGSEAAPAVSASVGPVMRKNHVNGQASLQFVGGGSTLETAAWSTTKSGPLTFLTVHWMDAAQTGNMGIASNVTNAAANWSYLMHTGSNNTYSVGFGATNQIVTPAVTRGQWVVTANVFNGASSRLYVNSKTPVTGTTGTAAMDALRIGNTFAGSAPFYGHIPYVRVCAKALTQAEIETEVNALATRYGITIA